MIAAALPLAFARPARALPLYASREGTKCASCHFDPNGGGMRNDFGFNYDKNRHSMGEEARWDSVDITPQLNPWIRLGMDTRVMYVATHTDGISGLSTSTFFPMQGNLRVAITPHEHLAVIGSHGIVIDAPGFPTPYVARELYGMIRELPHGAFVKIGRFRIPFGLRQDDHTSFTRVPEFLSYDSQKEDAGISAGSVGKHGWLEFSFTNGNNPAFSERAQAVAGKIAWAWIPLQGGVSGYHQYSELAAEKFDRWSLYLTKTLSRITLLGEYAGGTDAAVGDKVNKLAAFGELDYRVSRGVNLRGKFDYLDPDRGAGGDIWRRYVGEIDMVPMPFTEFKVSYRHYNNSTTPDYDEFLGQLFIPF